jgi:hypothetical protein
VGLCLDGVRLDHGCAARVHVDLYRAIMGEAAPPVPRGAPWYPMANGFLQIVGGIDRRKRDGLIDLIVERLVMGGFLPPLDINTTIQDVTTRLFSGNVFAGGDAGPLVGINNPSSGLWKAFNELRWPGKTPAQWPSGVNFGPSTHNNELRIHPEFLKALLRPMPTQRELFASTRMWRKTGVFEE